MISDHVFMADNPKGLNDNTILDHIEDANLGKPFFILNQNFEICSAVLTRPRRATNPLQFFGRNLSLLP